MDDPGVIANRLATTAKALVTEAQNLAVDACTDDPTAANMIVAYTKSVDLALSGTQRLMTALLKQEQPQEDSAAQGRNLLADALAVIGRRMVRQTGAVAREAADQVDKDKSYTPSAWTKSMVKLADIAVLGAIEMAETALIGPAPFEVALMKSDDYHASGAGYRKLRVRTPTGLARPGTADAIPANKLCFYTANDATGVELDNDLLQAAQTKFCIAVDARGMISGVYVGFVDILGSDATGMVAEGAAPIDAVRVRIAL
jgi:hypothetical protein